MKENSSRIIVDNYLKTRRKAIDVSEWYDILWALRGLGAKPRDFIVELGAGEGFLLDFLKMKGLNMSSGSIFAGTGKKSFEWILSETTRRRRIIISFSISLNI